MEEGTDEKKNLELEGSWAKTNLSQKSQVFENIYALLRAKKIMLYKCFPNATDALIWIY